MRRLVTLFAGAVLAVSAVAQGPLKTGKPEEFGMDGAKLQQVDRVIGEAISDKSIPGAVVSVVRGDRIVYLKAYGNKSLVPKMESMTKETMFDLASVSKCVGTTLSFMQLIENGYVRLTDNVDRYIPDFKPWEDPETGEKVNITVRDLMTHSSGLDAYIGVDKYVAEFGENTPDKLETYIATRVKRNFRPGTKCLYSCLTFITLQRILERVTGERLCDYAQNHVFDPLGLRHTCYIPTADKKKTSLMKLCAPTEVQADGLPLVGAVHDPIARRINGGNSGNAGVFSNAEDLSVIC
ncbi:MAG: serine hydrolase, partial [Bacteroidales bacterium]|nr:serine hydrolase [Bacteroidales bacterium]